MWGGFREISAFPPTVYQALSPLLHVLLPLPSAHRLRHATWLGTEVMKEETRAKRRRRRSALRSVAEECASKSEHGYKRIALPLQRCDVIAQICSPSSPFSLTLLFLLQPSASLTPISDKSDWDYLG